MFLFLCEDLGEKIRMENTWISFSVCARRPRFSKNFEPLSTQTLCRQRIQQFSNIIKQEIKLFLLFCCLLITKLRFKCRKCTNKNRNIYIHRWFIFCSLIHFIKKKLVYISTEVNSKIFGKPFLFIL